MIDTIESNKQTCYETFFSAFLSYLTLDSSSADSLTVGGISSRYYRMTLDSAATATLTNIAYQPAITGGEGVYYARAMLGLDIEDETLLGEGRVANSNKTTSIPGTIEPIGKFYPNPAKDILNFDYTIDENKQGIISFMDLLGRIISETQFLGNKNHLEIDVSQLRSGIYFINVQVDGSILQRTKEIIVK